MAPALSEPLSPTEKLSSSTAKATPATRSSSKVKVDDPTVSSTATTSASSSASTPTNREKRNRISVSTVTSTSNTSRVTRSKDAYQRIFEQALTTSPSPSSATTSSIAPAEVITNYINQQQSKPYLNVNEQMGLNAALNTTNNHNETNSDLNLSSKNNTNNNNLFKDNSTEQLLADLTNDFEEAITAEICLRKQLLDANLGKSADPETSGTLTAREPKDILVIKVGSVGGAAAKISSESQHMESQKLGETQEESDVLKPQAAVVNKEDHTREKKDDHRVKISVATTATVHAVELTDLNSQRHETQRLQILSVEELPPISTDSTMTASEVEDNLEERLSQLDGTAIVSSTSDETIVATTAMGVITAQSSPRTPTKLQQQTHQQQVQQLQQQLQQTPPTPLSHQLQQQQLQAQNSYTPQSTTSSMNILGSAQGFIKETAAGDLEDQDIEEVLKALKGFDGTSGTDTLCDLNVLFNEVYTTLNNYEEMSSQPASSSTPTSKPNPLKEMQTEIEKKQLTMQRKIDFLVRRLRKMQSRYMSKHTSEEVAGLFEWSARVASKGGSVNAPVTDDVPPTGSTAMRDTSVIAARPPACNWAEEKKNPVPLTQMGSMLRKLELVSNAQQLCTSPSSTNVSLAAHTHLKKSRKSMLDAQAASASSLSCSAIAATSERKGETVVPIFDMKVAEEMTHVAGLLQAEMREVQNAIDSDATESSSGGESADEMVTYNNQIQQPLLISKRAAWRYSRDRAAIASRWAWLLSQIADLEIKIRQHSELNQEIVRSKGAVICGFEKMADSAAASATTSVNGYKGAANVSAVANDNGSNSGIGFMKNNENECLPGSCRTRGYVASQFRKRKLFQTTNIHTFSKKAARPSTIKCGCQWPLYPCALCTGRSDPTAPRDLPDTMMLPERVALLDPGYHPVLSFPEDVSNTLHFEAIARLPEWQQRIMRCQVKSIAKSIWKAEREAAAAAGHHHTSKKYGGDSTIKRRYIKKKDRLQMDGKTTGATTAAAPIGGVGAGGSPTTAATAAANDAGGIGTANFSTSTTPLVANKTSKNSKKVRCHPVGDGILLEPLSPVATNNSSTHSQSSNSHHSQYVHQTSDYPLQSNYDQFNPNQAHSSLISNSSNSKNNKYRKLSTSTTNAFYHHHNNHTHHHYNNSNQYYNSNGNSEMNFLHTNDNWDCLTTRSSRASSPSHGGSSNYHKYERSLDRKNRSSYDIDNIVIPYSVAAATRVEILPYKEIPTPKWRVIENDNENSDNPSSKEDEEVSEVIKTADVSNGLQTEEDEVKSHAMTGESVAKILTDTEKVASDIEKSASDTENPASDTEKPASDTEKPVSDTEKPLSDKDIPDLDKVKSASVKEKPASVKEKPASKLISTNVEFDRSTNEVATNVETNNIDAKPRNKSPCSKKTNNMLKNNNKVIDCETIKNHQQHEEMQSSGESFEKTTKWKRELDQKHDEPVAMKLKKEEIAEANANSSNIGVGVTVNNIAKANSTADSACTTVPIENETESAEASAREEPGKEEESMDEGSITLEDLEEDITDEAMTLRHERALTEERRKFQTFLKFPWSTRSRANRRIDSRAESSGANTPDPTSPAPHTPSVGGGDQESIPSPLAPSTPLNPLDSILEAGENASAISIPMPVPATITAAAAVSAIGINNFNSSSKLKYERRRTTSTKKEQREAERRSTTPDPKELIPPYEALKFPLNDEEFGNLLQAMPNDYFCYYQDDSKYFEDCQTISIKSKRSRNNLKNDFTVLHHKRISKSTTATAAPNCDVNSRRQRLNNSVNHKIILEATAADASSGSGGGVGVGGAGLTAATIIKAAGALQQLPYQNGNKDNSIVDEDYDEEMDINEEDDDDDYPKHHLAPNNDEYDDYDNDEYGAYVGRRSSMLRAGDSEGESSDTEPFQDDDPNDPEWKGETDERSEKMRKKV